MSLVSRPSEYVRFARTRLLTRAALIRAATVRERSAQRTELRSRDTSHRGVTPVAAGAWIDAANTQLGFQRFLDSGLLGNSLPCSRSLLSLCHCSPPTNRAQGRRTA